MRHGTMVATMTDLPGAPVPLHMGALHPVEQLVVLVVAFGPFLVLFVVVYVARRRAIAEEEAEQQAGGVEDDDGRLT
jgi:hypothetical protein